LLTCWRRSARPLLLLPDPGRDVLQELDDLLLAVGRGLQDVQDGLGRALVLGQQSLQPHVQRLLHLLLLLAEPLQARLGAALGLLGSVGSPDLPLRFLVSSRAFVG